METYTYKKALLNLLDNAKETMITKIEHDDLDEYILITCPDKTVYQLKICPPDFQKGMTNYEYEKDKTDSYAGEYIKTHSKQDFMKSLNLLATENPEFIDIFMVLFELKELNIISNYTLKNIVHKMQNH